MNLQEKFTKYLTSEGFVYSDLTLESFGDYTPRDAEWNYSDVPHLNYVHKQANTQSFAIEDQFISTLVLQDFLFFKKIPILVNSFHSQPDHHSYCFQIFFFFIIIETVYFTENNQTCVRTKYRIFTKPLFKLLHYFVKLSLKKNYKILMSEDIPMREQKAKLRRKGYKFTTDADYLIGHKQTVNINRDNLIYPPDIKTGKTYTFTLGELEKSKAVRVANGKNELILSVSDDKILIFPGYCPHEGAILEMSIPHGQTVTCPWHGRVCKPLLICDKPDAKSQKFFRDKQFDLKIEEDKLILIL